MKAQLYENKSTQTQINKKDHRNIKNRKSTNKNKKRSEGAEHDIKNFNEDIIGN